MTELWVSAPFASLGSTQGGTVSGSAPGGGLALAGEWGNHSCIAAERQALGADAVGHEVKLALVEGIGEGDVSIPQELLVGHSGPGFAGHAGPRTLYWVGPAGQQPGAWAGRQVVSK